MFQDEARFGRLPVIRAAWAPPGVRPVVLAAVERQFRYVYGAVSPLEGDLDWRVADSMKTPNMSAFLAQISAAHPHDFILMVLDGASSHKSQELILPAHMRLLPLPPYAPELNPTEGLWDEVREKVCANTYFAELDPMLAGVDQYLKQLATNPAQVASMFCRPWIIWSV